MGKWQQIKKHHTQESQKVSTFLAGDLNNISLFGVELPRSLQPNYATEKSSSIYTSLITQSMKEISCGHETGGVWSGSAMFVNVK